MHVPLWVWLATGAGICALLALSFFVHVRKAHVPTVREAGAWTAFFVTVSLLFGLGLGLVAGWDHGLQFLAGYITEYSLSVDNLFVFVLIMSSFAVPAMYQEKVLMFGIVIALILRLVFILLGAAAIARFSWVFHLFGLFLIITAVRLFFVREEPDGGEYRPNMLVRLAQRVLPLSDDYDGARLTTRRSGHWQVTPLLLVMLAVGFTDILFALDSIPAIFGLTNVPYIVFTSNAFALLGLIELYFLIGGLLKRLIYLQYGLAVLLAFIGVKLVLEALHRNTLPFIAGGGPVAWAPEISTVTSLLVIVAILGVTTIASLLVSRQRADG